MDEEFAFHLDMETRKFQRAGFDAAEARRRALVVFGGVQRHRQDMRYGRGLQSLFDVAADVRRAATRLFRRPAFTIAVVLTLAVGLGALASAYGVLYGVLIRPLPYPESERLVMVWQTRAGWERFPASFPIYREWSRRTTSFIDLAAYGVSHAIVRSDGESERVPASPATANLAQLLGVPPALGRWYTETEDLRGEPVVVVSHDYWRTRLGGTPAVVGQTLLIDDQPRTIIGVMSSDFRFPSERTMLWVPLGPVAREQGWNSQSLAVAGRLRPGQTLDGAASEVAAITASLVESGESPPVGSRVVRRIDDVLGDVRRTLVLAFAAACGVLLIGLVNITNLFLSRGVNARQEFAIRQALGASRLRVAWEFIAEGLLLGTGGAIAGLLLAAATIDSLRVLLPVSLPRLTEVTVDTPVVLAVLAVASLAGLLLGLVSTTAAGSLPSRGPSHLSSSRYAKSRGARSFQNVLVGAQVTGVFALISVAGLMSVSFERLVDAERGFDEAHLIALVEPEPLERRYATAMARDALWRRVRERLAAVHGVTGAALVAPMPFGGSERTTTILPPGNRDPITFGVTEISSGALDILGVQLTLGREFSIAEEGPGTAVAVVSESFARQLRPDGRVLGITIPLGGATSGNVVQIVGVASDVRQSDLRSAVLPRVWIPYTRIPGDDISVIVRADEPERLAPALHGAVADVDPTLAAERLAPMSVLVRGSAAFDRFRALALAILALAGALMAAIGMYGVTSYAVAERRLELSIRNALGAPADRLLREALGAQLRVVAIGLTAGFPAAVVAGQLLQAFLHQVTPLDASVHVITALAILGLTAAATLMPGLRALRADPSVALREQ